MPPLSRNCSIISGILIVLFSIAILLVNQLFFQYKGNNYLPEGVYAAGFSLVLTLVGVRTFLEKDHYIRELTQTILSLYLVMCVIALLTNAVQFTPFTPIDNYLIDIDHLFRIDVSSIVPWTQKYPWFQYVLVQIYDSLPFQMAILPILVGISGKFHILREYFCLMLVSALIGFVFYYFFPTTAPASNFISSDFSILQHATGLKFSEIHNHLVPSTIEGGMIALPSFHTIWAWFCLYLVRHWFWVFAIVLPVNLLLVLSCVLLGWHYMIDIAGAVIVILITHGIHHFLAKKN